MVFKFFLMSQFGRIALDGRRFPASPTDVVRPPSISPTTNNDATKACFYSSFLAYNVRLHARRLNHMSVSKESLIIETARLRPGGVDRSCYRLRLYSSNQFPTTQKLNSTHVFRVQIAITKPIAAFSIAGSRASFGGNDGIDYASSVLD